MLFFYQYVSKKRIEQAELLLAREDMSITDVASASGFESLSAFIRILRSMLMKNSHQDAISKASSTESAIISQYAKAFNLKNVSQIFDECNKTLYHIERNGNSSLVFTDWYLKVAELIAPRP